ncbi:hypothetical protein [Shewanella marina]|uniref:hypothetical protein n=1 Tax=Shewanella marina TaxID=487319 RepID=UPI000ABD2248|nr:hypothetical protein [Shewanella marina]
MTDKSPKLPPLSLPWWMDGETLPSSPEAQEPALLKQECRLFGSVFAVGLFGR